MLFRSTVFAPESAEISEGDDDVWIGNRGKLIQVFVDGDRAFTVNGEELFMNRERKDSIRIYARRDRVHGLRGCSGGQAFDIYDEPISLQVYLPEGGNVLQYRIGVDDEPFRPLGDYCGAGERDFVLTVPDDSIKRHRIRINDVGSGKTVSEFSYAILPGVKVKPDHKLIYDDAKQVSGKICYDGCDLSLSDYPPESGDWLEVTPEHLPYALEVRLPLVRGTLRDQNIFELPHMTWWTQLRSDAFVKLQVPTGWEAALYLGACAVPKNPTDGSFELSNLISSGYRPGKTAGLSLKMQSRDGLQDIRILGNIAFEEHFTSSPVLLDGGTLKWQPEGRYVGPEDDELRLQVDIDGQTPFEYVVACNRSETLDRRFSSDLGYGEYPFRLLKKQGIFAKEKVVYEDTLPVGEPAMWRLRGKYL